MSDFYQNIKDYSRSEWSMYVYHKVASTNTSCLEARAGCFRFLMMEILVPYVLGPFYTKLITQLRMLELRTMR